MPHSSKPDLADELLCRFGVRRHRSEIMFSVLVIILRPDHVAGLGLSLSYCEVPLILSLRVSRASRIEAGDIRCPLLRRLANGLADLGRCVLIIVFWPFCMA